MAAPQLRLEVSLNLAGFRGEIRKLTNIAQSEFTPKINVKFNRQTLDTELNNLQAAIKRRTYRIEIGGNIDSFPRAIENIRKQLAALETQNKIEIPISVKNGVTQKEARKVRSSVYRSVMAEGGKILLPVGLRPVSQTASDKFKTDLRQKLGSITVKIKADLESASISSGAKSRSDIEADVRRGLEDISEIGAQRMAGGTGGVTESARREQLKQSLSQGGFDIATLKEIGKQLGVSGVGRFKIANNLIEKIVAESSIEMVKKYLDPQAVMRNPDRSGLGKVLDTFARGIFNMLGMDPASIRAQQQASRPKSFMPAGLLPPSAGPAGLLPPAYRGIGPSAKPAGLLPSLSSAGRSNAIIEALIASTGPRLLPSGGGDDSLGKLAAPKQTKDAVDAILRNYFKVVQAQVKEVFSAPPIKKESLNIFDYLDTEQYFNYLAQARINAENAIKRSIEEAKQVTKRNQIKDAAQSFLRALEEVVRNAERSIFLQSRIAANQSYVQRANIREIGQPLLGGRQVTPPKMLSAATGFYRGAATPPPLPETQTQLFARREREARMRSVLRGVDVMGETPTRAPARYSYANRPAMPRRPTSAIVPYEAGGAIVPSGRGGGGAPPVPPRGGGGGGSFGGMQFNVPKLPGAGLVREIGTEFGFAAKQVLLYGTAYKALGLLQAFPSQVGEAVGALQSFRNTLNAISPTAQEAAASSAFILNIVDKYNVPLQSARDGFTKLYASMAPTGFSGNEIRDLFTGISQAAATFGMSSDKVDRVTYAFAQMASKGQVMSEELKGQLGDVLPGAMAIFAKAAGFEGADAIQKFGKALEDGAYKGKPMRDLLKNVTIELKKEFGPGAEGAARTYQGVMTRMANSTKLFYETFEPVAVGFLNSVVMPLTNGLRTITEGVRAYFQGQQAATPEAENFNNVLKTLAPSLGGIAQNIGFALKQLLPMAQVLGAVAVQISRFLALPLIGYLAGTYLQVVLLTSGFQLLATSGLGLAILATIQFIRQGILAASVMVGMQRATQQTTLATVMFGQTLQIVMAKSVIGIALVAIGALIAKIMELRGQLSAIGNDAKGMESLAKSSAKMGDIEGTQEAIGNIKDRLATFKELQKELKSAKKTSAGGSMFDDRGAISTSYQVSSATAKKLIELGLVNEKVLTRTSSGYSLLEDQMGTVNSLVNKNVNEFQKAGQKGNILIDQAIRKNREQKATLVTGGIDISAGEDDLKEKNKEASRINQYLQENLKLNTERGIIGKDELTQLEAKVKLAQQIFLLEREDIKLNEKGKAQQLALNNATLAYQVIVAQANDDWQKATQGIKEIGLQVTEVTDKILGLQSPERSPLQKALSDLKKEAIDNIQTLEKLRKSIKKLAGERPEGKIASAGIDQAFALLNTQDPLLAASKRVTNDIVKDLQAKLKELNMSGKTLTTLDEVILKLGDDWNSLSPAIKTDITNLATQIDAAKPFAEMASAIRDARQELEKMLKPQTMAISAAKTIGDAFGTAFKGIITGSMTAQEALANMFQSIADRFADMVTQMIAKWLETQVLQGFQALFKVALPVLGAAAGGLSSGFGAGTSSAIDTGATGWANSFATPLKFANGGIAAGGFTAFANGGVVTGPTLGLVGEGRYNEAVIPLPDGKSVPVQLSGGDGGNQINSNITVNVSNGQAQSNATGSNSSELGRKIEGAVKQVIVGELRPGGLLASR